MAGRSWLTKMIVNVNVICEMLFDPCDAPFSVYAETLFPAVLDMLTDFYAFDVSEYQQQRPFSSMQPKNRKSARKTRFGKKGGGMARWRGILGALSSDPGELLGKRMAKNFGGSRRLLTGATSHLWLLGGALQRTAFWFWFIGRAGGVFYDWYMGLLYKGYCSDPEMGVFTAYESADASHALFGWKPLLVWTILKQRGAPNWHISYGTSGNWPLIVVATMVVVSRDDFGSQSVQFRVVTDGPSGEREVLNKTIEAGEDIPQNLGLTFEMEPASTVTIEVRNDRGLVDLYDVFINGFSRRPSSFDPVVPYPRDFRGRRLEPFEF